MAAVACPSCKQRMAYIAEFAGQRVACPSCSAHLTMPQQPPAAEPSYEPPVEPPPAELRGERPARETTPTSAPAAAMPAAPPVHGRPADAPPATTPGDAPPAGSPPVGTLPAGSSAIGSLPVGTPSAKPTDKSTDAGVEFVSSAASDTAAPAANPRERRKWRQPTSVWDLFDFRFEKYLTPWIVRFTWIVALILVTIWLLGYCSVLLIDFSASRSGGVTVESSGSSTPNVSSASGDGPSRGMIRLRGLIFRAAYIITGVLTAIIVLLWVRVTLETVIVLFNIANTLTAIEDQLRG